MINDAAELARTYFETGTLPGLPEGHFIGGKFVAGSDGETIESFDPGSARAFARFSAGKAEDVFRAVEAAEKGLAVWRDTAPAERCRVLNRAAMLIRERAEYLSVLESLDSGKTLDEARGDVRSCARLFEYYAGAADKLEGRSIPLGAGLSSWTEREPVGITAQIIPWNYPTSTFARGIAPALAAGCAVVAKPAETTPFTALVLAGWLHEAGVPAGVVNVVTGLGVDAGAALVRHPSIAHVTFTGSVRTGVGVMQAAAPNVTQLTLELGGKSPLVALADSDVDKVVDGALWAIFSNAGQICSAGSRLVIDRKIHSEVLEKLVQKARALRLGHGLKGPDVGALNSEAHLGRVHAHVEAARQRGRSILTGGKPVTDPETGAGWFYEPTIIDGLPCDDPAVQEEIFGPVLAVQVVDGADEAIAAANGTEYGLVAGIYTRDISEALRLARAIDAGQVTINDYWAGGVEVPFGGNRKSGFGREKGLEGIEAYVRTKAITIRH
ncbi:aldehyde dehydrogenase family protein [Mesorhizobium sp. KR1-2]|uniref:aldehyde dehydrogenase family protein n=1 Tax=Mesorhizobium sp. KR1-2 TaxID=3156609 RepID=UPI0032B5A866